LHGNRYDVDGPEGAVMGFFASVKRGREQMKAAATTAAILAPHKKQY
jgi:hypothetical protein